MPKFHPETKVTAVAQFTKHDGVNPDPVPGKFDGAATWASSNTADTFSQTDDGAAGTSTAQIDGSKNPGDGETSSLSCTVDADLGKGVVNVTVQTDPNDPIVWTRTVDIEADGGTVTMTQV